MTAASPVQTLWSHTHPSPWRGLSLARERGLVLAWDDQHILHLFNRRGELQGRWSSPDELTDAACADDGTALAATGAGGKVWLLAPDLTVRWERRVPGRAVSVAVETLARAVAVGDGAGTLNLFDRHGTTVWQALNPRPLHYLAFVPEEPRLVVASDFGLVAGYDPAGQCVWRDGLVSHVGSLAVSGDGTSVVLACFSEGLCCYHDGDAKSRRFLPRTAPVHLAALSYDGKTLLTTDREHLLVWRNADGTIRREMTVESKPVALALAATGDRALVAFADGRLAALE